MPDQSRILFLLATTALACAAPAAAQSADVEKRLQAMEAEIAKLRSELAQTRATASQAGQAAPVTAATATETRLAAVEAKVAKPVDGFKVGAATFKVGGFIKLWSAVSSYGGGTLPAGALGRDFYLPQQLPVGGEGTTHFNAHVKQTRLWLGANTPVADRTLTGYVEIDFQTAPGTQGSERTTNGYNPSLRRGYFTIDKVGGGTMLFGQEWSTFQNVAVLPETTDFIGPTEGSVFVRQPQIRWTTPLSKAVMLSLAVENPETATITSDSATMVENDDDKWPDLVAKLGVKAGKAELTLAGLVHDLSVNEGPVSASTTGFGVSGAGRIPFGPDGRHDLKLMLTYGQGIGHYVGLNFAPDAVIANGELHAVDVLAGFAAVKIGWTPKLRSTFMASFQDVNYPDVVVPAAANAGAWSLAGNLFVTPVKGFDVGVEFRHGERELVSGATGDLNRFELAAKYSF